MAVKWVDITSIIEPWSEAPVVWLKQQRMNDAQIERKVTETHQKTPKFILLERQPLNVFCENFCLRSDWNCLGVNIRKNET